MADNNDLFQFDDFSGTDIEKDTFGESSDSGQDMVETEAESLVVGKDRTGAETEYETDDVSSASAGSYDDDAIQHLDWNEHIRRRPGMYIGKLGDGSHAEDGIYVLIKEVVDNSIDEFNMGAGKRIDITLTEEGEVTIRDYGRGIPLGKVKEVASEINTGGKFDDKNFKKSVGLNGVGLKAVNALSTYCHVASVRDGKTVVVDFEKGNVVNQSAPTDTREPNGTMVRFLPDNTSSAITSSVRSSLRQW